MNNELKFRQLRADEIDVRIGDINRGGVSLLLYKDARCDQNILDETVGPMNWQRHHSRDNANCIVSIRNSETGEWIEKEDTGTESSSIDEFKKKGLASDSFKRACFNWGIGRELYTAPKMFIFKDKLKNFKEASEGKFVCFDKFKVEQIEYLGSQIKEVVIGCYDGGKKYLSLKYSNETALTVTSTQAEEVSGTTAEGATETAADTPAPTAGITDDEVILIGNCRGRKYGEVKNTETFTSFLRWVKNANTSYSKPEQQNQYIKLKALASSIA